MFRLGGADVVVHDIEVQDRQFDLRVTESTTSGTIVTLVECKDLAKPVGLDEVEKFGRKRQTYELTTKSRVQAVLVSRRGFVGNAHEVAKQYFVELATFDDLLLRLFDKTALIESARRHFVGTELERQYVEQSAVLLHGDRLDGPARRDDIEQAGTGHDVADVADVTDAWLRAPLRRAALFSRGGGGRRGPPGAAAHARLHLGEPGDHWLEPYEPGDNEVVGPGVAGGAVFVLLADMGMGKTSFAKSLAATMADRAGRDPEAPVPLLVDLREMGSAAVQLESILMQALSKASNRKVSSAGLLHVIAAGRVVPIFDGLDEMLAYADPNRYLANLSQLLRVADGGGRAIITCRTSFFTSQPDEILKAVEARINAPVLSNPTPLYRELMRQTGVTIGYLLPFSDEQVDRFLARVETSQPGLAAAVRLAISRSDDLRDLSRHPL